MNVKQNLTIRKIACKSFTSEAIGTAFSKCKSADQFFSLLGKKKINCYATLNTDNTIKQIDFVDNRNKSVFTNTDLGLSMDDILLQLANAPVNHSTSHGNRPIPLTPAVHPNGINQYNSTASSDILKLLLSVENSYDDISPEFLKKKKKRSENAD